MTNSIKKRVFFPVRFLFLSLILFLQAFSLAAEDERLINGVRIGSYNVGGMSQLQVQELLTSENQVIMEKKLSLQLKPTGEMIAEFTYGQLGIALDIQQIWQEAYQLGRQGNWWQRWRTRWEVKRRGREIPLHLILDKAKAEKALQAQTGHLKVPAQDARLMVTPRDRITILPEAKGREPNIEQALADLEKELINPNLSLLILDFRPLEPKLTARELAGYKITGLVSNFTTSYNTQKINRSRNIQLAATAVDGVIIPPGQIFSFNQVVGPRTKEKGYDEADVIINNQLVPDIGGGVCQVSSTLYNAVLRANLEIVERHPHSLLIRYVAPGMDAAVSYGSLDFSFRNNTDGHILIRSYAHYGTLTFKIFGLAEGRKKVLLKSFKEKEVPPRTIFLNDPLVPQGEYILEQDGYPGIYIRVERYIYQRTGEFVRKELVSRDYYPPVDRVIRTSTDSSLLSNMPQ